MAALLQQLVWLQIGFTNASCYTPIASRPLIRLHPTSNDADHLSYVKRRTPIPIRLFSSAGDLYTDSRSQLSGRLADMLLFIKHNLKFIWKIPVLWACNVLALKIRNVSQLNYIFLCTLMTMPFQCCCGNKLVTLMCCSDYVILGISIDIGYWYRWRPIVLAL